MRYSSSAGVHVAGRAGDFEQALQLAGKRQPARLVAVDQRFLAQAIAAEHQLPPPRIPEGDGEHPVQVPKAVDALVFVQVDDRLRVATGREAVTGTFQPMTQFGEIVDLAVEDDPDRSVLV